MIIKTNNFTSVLEKYRFVDYRTFETDHILYITLYGEEESEKFVIMEPLTEKDRTNIHMALKASQKSARMSARA